MWARLDDELIDHRKVFVAGELLGKNGPAIAIGFYAVGLMWSNKHLTDGHLPSSVVRSFHHVDRPGSVAEALVKAGLWEKNGSGYQIHDYHDFNLTAADIKSNRAWDRRRKELYSDPGLIAAIRTRDQDRCRYCGREVRWRDRRGPLGGQYDHVIARGPNTLDNIVTACRRCNNQKGNRSMEAAGMTLLPPPKITQRN